MLLKFEIFVILERELPRPVLAALDITMLRRIQTNVAHLLRIFAERQGGHVEHIL
jgi:hypothetical protein